MKRIGRYELLECLGGGMSQVYRAHDTLIGRTVAVKILNDAACKDPETKERFLAEARMAGTIEHQNICAVYDFGEDELQRPFLVMEFLRGETLLDAIRNGHTGGNEDRLNIALQVARALEYVHAQRIIHRDIKPENVQITPGGVAKLIDFGIAKMGGASITQPGDVIGTPLYMAPEQINGETLTEEVDVYSFGILLFELFTGRKPIADDTLERVFYQVLNEPLDLEPLRVAGVPQSLRDLIRQCTEKNPANRPRGFRPVCTSLKEILSESEQRTQSIPNAPSSPEPVLAPRRGIIRRSWLLLFAGALVAVVGGAFYLFQELNGRKVEPAPPPPPVVQELAKTLPTPTGEMLLIPAGAFRSGGRLTPIANFYIDETEVTNRAYSQFCDETHRKLPPHFPEDRPDYPVVNVNHSDAEAFAEWAHKRLPTSLEWEKAARGMDNRLFPWGDEPDQSRANIGTKALVPVTAFSTGRSPYGALNMIGNAWEWTRDSTFPNEQELRGPDAADLHPPPNADEPWYLIRGLSFQSPPVEMPYGLKQPAAVPGRVIAKDIGFRCARDPEN